MSKIFELMKLNLDEMDTWNEEQNKMMDMFVSFVHKYTKHLAPKDVLHSAMRNAQKAAFEADPTKEKANKFECILDFMTDSDIAWSIWAVDNGHNGWIEKKMDPDNMSLKYSSKSKSSAADYDPVEGNALYDSLLKWVNEKLFASEKYPDIQVRMNETARKLGFFSELKSKNAQKKEKRAELIKKGVTAPKVAAGRRVVPGMDGRITNVAAI